MSSKDNNILLEKLDQFIRKYYLNQLIKGVIYVLAIVLSSALFFLIIEHFAHFNSIVRGVIFYCFLILLISTMGKWVALPLFKSYKLGKRLSYEDASQIIGDHFSEVQDKLLNLLQLRENNVDRKEGNELILASIDQRMKSLQPVQFNLAIDFNKNLKYVKYAVVPIVVMLIMGLASPNMLLEPSNRIINYQSEFLPQAPFEFNLLNEEFSVVKNSDYKLKFAMSGEVLPAEVYVEYDGRRDRAEKLNKTDFSYTLKNMQEDTELKLYADQFYSQPIEIQVLPNPLLLSFEVSLQYPKYLKINNEELKNIGDLQVPEGTKIKWSFKTENSEELKLKIGSKTIGAEAVDDDEFEFETTAENTQSYSIITSNEFHRSDDAVGYRISVIKDAYPQIALNSEADSIQTGVMHCYGKAEDDHGLTELTFNYRRVSKKGGEEQFKPIKLPLERGVSFTNYYYRLDAKKLDMKLGEEVEFYFEVADNDGVNGAKRSKTARSWMRLNNLEEMKEKASKNLAEVKKGIEEAMKDAKEIKQNLNKLSRKLVDKKNKTWEDQQQFNAILEQQQKLERKVQKLQDNYKKNNELTKEFSEPNQALMEKQERLNELMESLMNDEMKQTMAEIQQLLEEMNKEKFKEKVEDMALNNEDLEKELDRSLELMKQLEFEQKLEETLSKVDELKKEQEELRKETESSDKKDLEQKAEKQEELSKKFDEIKKDIAELEEKNKSMEFPNEMESTDEAQEKVSQEMKKSQEKLGKGDKKSAPQNQKKAEEGLEEMAQNLQQTMSNMFEKQAEDIDAMRQLLDNVMTASFDQEELMNKLKGLSSEDPKYVDAMVRQGDIRDNIQLVKDSLFALSKRIVQMQSVVNKEINAIDNSISRALKDLQERRTGPARGRQQLAMTGLNNLALLLDEIISMMQEQMAAKTKPGDKSCNKPGSQSKPNGGGKPKLSDMQKQMNKQLERLKNGQNKGGKEGKMGQGEMSKELAKMAARQAALREQLNQMGKETNGKNGKKLGEEMKKIAELMEQTETDIVNRQITRETLLRQEEITTRLLESEKAERERELDKKRESTEFIGDLSNRDKQMEEYYKKSENEVELLRTMIPSYNAFYKKKISEYFKSLSE